MLLNTELSAPVERQNVSDEKACTIKTTAKAYEILSSGIYTLPIEAIVRELSCNAYDSHVAAQNAAQPYDITLPTITHPTFIIRDYGTGLSKDNIFNIYTTYFESTKTESNDFIGALGLGSKSPFSYTKAFRVISYFEGTKDIYSIFLNDNAVPHVALLGTFPTTEHNGLQIEVPVKLDDINRFVTATKHTLKFFPVKPNVIGYENFTFERVNVILSNENKWLIVDNTAIQHKFIAVQGNVQYKIDIIKIQSFLSTESYKLLSQLNIVLLFDNGEIEFSSSREEIRYNDNTIAKVLKRIHDIEETLVNHIVNSSMQYEHLDIVSYYKSINDLLNTIFYSNSSFIRNFLLRVPPNQIPDNIKLSMYIQNKGLIPIKFNEITDITTCKFGNSKFMKVKHKSYDSSDSVFYDVPQAPHVFFIDSTFHYKKLIKQYLHDNKLYDCSVILVHPPEYNSIDEVYNQILQYFNYVKVSDLIVKYPSINTIQYTKTRSAQSFLKTIMIGYSRFKYENYYIDEKPLPRFYIDINKDGIVMPNGIQYTGDHRTFISNMLLVAGMYYNETIKITDLVGVLPSGKKYINKTDCINIVDVISKYIAENKSLIDSGFSYLNLVSVNYNFCTMVNKPVFIDFINKFNKRSMFYKFYEPCLEYLLSINSKKENQETPIVLDNTLMYFFKSFYIVNKIQVDIKPKITHTQLIEQYVLIDLLKHNTQTEAMLTHLYEYIIAIDKKKNRRKS
jgi:hypothetical protein